MTREIAVIGAGIAGITAAYFLAKQGHKVSVYEEEPYPAMKTSYANGGQVSTSNSEVWTTWSNVLKGAKWILKKDAPLLIRPSLDLDKALWLAKFLYHTANNDYLKNTIQTIKLGLESRQLYQQIIDQEQLEFDQSYCGILHFYKDAAYWDWAKKAQHVYEDAGCEFSLLTPEQVKSKDPALKDIKDIVGGTWTADDWTGDIHKFCYQLSNVLVKKYGVNFFYNRQIDNLDSLDFYDTIVIANGVGSVKLARSIGESLPIYPVKGYSITIQLEDLDHAPRVSLLDDQKKIVTSLLGDRLRIAGTAEFAGENYDIRRDRIEPLLSWVKENFPRLNTHNYSSWACLRPMTPNMMPIVRSSTKNTKVFFHTGHGHLGWTLSPATARHLVGLINDR